MYAAFPSKSLEKHAVAVVRCDFYGRTITEVVVGAAFNAEPINLVWLLIHRGHMRLLRPPPGDMLAGLAQAESRILDLPSLGWEAFLELAMGDPMDVLSKNVPPCQRCHGKPACRPRGAGEFADRLCHREVIDNLNASQAKAGRVAELDADPLLSVDSSTLTRRLE